MLKVVVVVVNVISHHTKWALSVLLRMISLDRELNKVTKKLKNRTIHCGCFLFQFTIDCSTRKQFVFQR